jgi:Formyl transferase, C-terminal domain
MWRVRLSGGFDQFALDEETSKMSKSELYRGPVTTAALNACLVALERITIASTTGDNSSSSAISVDTPAPAEAREKCASQGLPFQGGQARDRPLLKASTRDFVPLVKALSCSGQKISAEVILQRIQSGDSQPGVLSALLGAPLFLYDAHVERGVLPADVQARHQGADENGAPLGTILAMRDEALLVECGADYPIWIGHARRPKAKNEKYLHPKLPALLCVSAVQSLQEKLVGVPEWPIGGTTGEEEGWAWRKREGTYQQIWAEMEVLDDGRKIAFVHFEF